MNRDLCLLIKISFPRTTYCTFKLFLPQSIFVLVFFKNGPPPYPLSSDKIKSKTKPDRSGRYRQLSDPHTSVCLHLTTRSLLPDCHPAAWRPSPCSLRASANMQFHRSVLTAFMSTTQNRSLPSPFCEHLCG